MDPVSQVDRLVMVLRQRMLERAKGSSARRKDDAAGSRTGGLDGLQALAALDDVDDHQLCRALIQNILADQFGGQLINETRFQQVVERVTETLESDEAGALLIKRCLTELRNAAR